MNPRNINTIIFFLKNFYKYFFFWGNKDVRQILFLSFKRRNYMECVLIVDKYASLVMCVLHWELLCTWWLYDKWTLSAYQTTFFMSLKSF